MRKPDPVFPEEVKEKEKSDFRRFTSEFERGYGRGGGGGGGGRKEQRRCDRSNSNDFCVTASRVP